MGVWISIYARKGELQTIADPSFAWDKKSNAWGLFDIYGSVAEWCQDWYGDYHELAVTDPRGPQKGEFRVSRDAG